MQGCVLVTQSCSTLCNPMDYSPPGSLSIRILIKNTGVGCHSPSELSEKPRKDGGLSLLASVSNKANETKRLASSGKGQGQEWGKEQSQGLLPGSS